jgi:hypothetical protein
MLDFLKIWIHFASIDNMEKIIRHRGGKTLAPVVQALHTQNACDVFSC